jgi:hypothetical protein
MSKAFNICSMTQHWCTVLQSEAEQLLRPDDIQKPLNPRNEAAALALLLANQQSEPCTVAGAA